MLARRFNRCFTALVATAALTALVGLSGCADRPSSADCEKLLDHMIALEANAAGATPEQKADLEKQQGELRTAVKSQFMDQCENDTPGPYVRCALKKTKLEDLASCDQ